MARAYRCAAHPATAVWLDCYYGAAQPVRAALGMSPAPPDQLSLSETPPAYGRPTDISLRDQVMVGAGNCAAITEDRLWLGCFYAAANPARQALGLGLLAGNTQLPRQLPKLRPPRSGVLAAILGSSEIEVRARMVSYKLESSGFIVTLDNGQVWQQLEGDSSKAHWPKPANSYIVTISQGAFGSHNLTVKGVYGKFKVRRVS